MTAPGKLRERVRFERRAAAPDGFGNVEGAWQTLVGPVWAEIRPLRADEEEVARRLESVGRVEITIRYSSDVAALSADDRAVDARTGTVYAIRGVENRDMHKRYLVVTAETNVPNV